MLGLVLHNIWLAEAVRRNPELAKHDDLPAHVVKSVHEVSDGDRVETEDIGPILVSLTESLESVAQGASTPGPSTEDNLGRCVNVTSSCCVLPAYATDIVPIDPRKSLKQIHLSQQSS